MDKKYVGRFIERISGTKYPHVFFEERREIDKPEACAFILYAIIHINNIDGAWDKLHDIDQKAIIFHEVGHLRSLYGLANTPESELGAQLWGIAKAEKLGMHKVSLWMKLTLWGWSIQPGNYLKFRKHYLASKAAVQLGLISWPTTTEHSQ